MYIIIAKQITNLIAMIITLDGSNSKYKLAYTGSSNVWHLGMPTATIKPIDCFTEHVMCYIRVRFAVLADDHIRS